METTIGDYVRTTIGIHSLIPCYEPDSFLRPDLRTSIGALIITYIILGVPSC